MGKLTWLDAENTAYPPFFPPTHYALKEPNGLLAVGGDLSPERLLEAYKRGIFPWYEAGQPVLWWTPDPRMVLFPEECHVSRSLRKVIRQNRFHVTVDTCFADVIRGCAAPRDDAQGTWITQQMQQAYCRLHELGHAHSVEVWEAGKLVGGLYGIALGRIFFGESMFSRRSNASKVALASLADRLHRWEYRLIDCQVASEHLYSLGAREISRAEFEQILQQNRDDSAAPNTQKMAPANWQTDW